MSSVPLEIEIKVLEVRGKFTKVKHEGIEKFASISIGKEKYFTSAYSGIPNQIFSEHEEFDANEGFPSTNLCSFGWPNESFTISIPEVLETTNQDPNTSVINISIFLRKLLGDEYLGSAFINLYDFQLTPSNPKIIQTKIFNEKSDQLKCTEKNTASLFSEGEIQIELIFKKKETLSLSRTSSTSSLFGKIKGESLKKPNKVRNMKSIAQEVIRLESNKPKPFGGLGRIAQTFLSERRSIQQCTKSDMIVDNNCNELNESTTFVRIQSARGKINKIQQLNENGTDNENYIWKKVITRPRNSSSLEESEGDEEDSLSDKIEPSSNLINAKLQNQKIIHGSLKKSQKKDPEPNRSNSLPEQLQQNRKSSTTKLQDLVLPIDNKKDSLKKLNQRVTELEELVKLQEKKILDLENYIDGRLARILEKNPNSLEIDDYEFV